MAKRPAGKKPKPISDKQRASDDDLRKRLRDADMRDFDRVLRKAIRSPR